MTYFTTLSIEGSLSNQIFRNINGVEELQNAVIKFNHKAIILFFYPESDKKQKEIKEPNNIPKIKSSKDLITLISRLEKQFPNLKTNCQRPAVNNTILGQCSESTILINDYSIIISDFGESYSEILAKKVTTIYLGIYKNHIIEWQENIANKPIDEVVTLITSKVKG